MGRLYGIEWEIKSNFLKKYVLKIILSSLTPPPPATPRSSAPAIRVRARGTWRSRRDRAVTAPAASSPRRGAATGAGECLVCRTHHHAPDPQLGAIELDVRPLRLVVVISTAAHVTTPRARYSGASHSRPASTSASTSAARSTSAASLYSGAKPKRSMSGARTSPMTPRAISACISA